MAKRKTAERLFQEVAQTLRQARAPAREPEQTLF
jgi:hypothetical protein